MSFSQAPTMRGFQTEYLLKGVFLGLLAFGALHTATAEEVSLAVACRPWIGVGLGLVIGLAVAAWQKVREGYQVKRRLPAFLLFLVLESPGLVYGGILVGMAAGVLALPRHDEETTLLAALVAGGAALGLIFGLVRNVRDRWTRLGLSLGLSAALVAAALMWFGTFGDWIPQLTVRNHIAFGIQLLLGIPFFYLLTFSGQQEESEIEMGTIAALGALGLVMLTSRLPQAVQTMCCLLLAVVYLLYAVRILPGLRVFKHTIRGLSHAQIGRYRQALVAYRRALDLDPHYSLAREGYWAVHRSLDFDTLANDAETLAVVDFNLCLDRAGSLLLEPGPSAEKLSEAQSLLDLVANHRPDLRPTVDYWRAVAYTHAKQFDEAANALAQVLDPKPYGPNNPNRQSVLLVAWKLALFLHDELKRRAGLPQLALPGRRMEAIAAVEHQLTDYPDDADTWGLKRLLYQDVTEAEYDEAAGAPDQVVPGFDHAYAQQLGLALIDDPARWQRGGEYLRLAARGLPAMGPSIFSQIARACQKAGNNDGAWHNYELAKRAGQAVGPANLGPEERQAYFASLKLLAEGAMAVGDPDLAIENYQLYAESERSGVETLRTLAGLYEQKGNVMAALRATERGLLYNPKDPDLLARKDRYYYSLMPDTLRANPEAIDRGFDVDYCLRKAKAILAARETDFDSLDWAQHLAELASVVLPESRGARLLLARIKLRRGERDEALALLQQVHGETKPEQFESSEDEEAWFLSCRLLGDLYLNELARPDLAVACYQDFRQSPKSGADTSYKLGQAYEQLGDHKRAVKCYKQVTTFDSHPLAPDARDALSRLQPTS
jgi:tetratricopeptide (TPR) repeat protein